MDIELLDQQLSELELLRAMFPGVDELTLDDSETVRKIEDYVFKRSESLQAISLITFTVNLQIPAMNDKTTVELTSTFPRDYPHAKPHLHIRCRERSRTDEDKMNSALKQFLSSLPDGEICILPVIQWLKENGGSYLNEIRQETVCRSGRKRVESRPRQLSQLIRIWFYMHHIYSKQKRKDIVSWADELRLTGFSLPGKPGVVCVEGDVQSVEEYSQRIKAMNWKRITIRHHEVIDAVDGDLEILKKFGPFEELNFDAHASGKSRDYHMDLGQFCQYLEAHKAKEMFTILFGVDGKAANS